jgi:2-C-methyl-D-erythritol 4-phosphate cytidylyltransferase
MRKFTIIVAGGSGSRMKSSLPKQFIELCGKPILMHTIENFYRFDATIPIILVLPIAQFDFWQELCDKHQFKVKLSLVAGGETRFDSVKNGLAIVKGDGLVAVHDGVRPLVSHEAIARCFEMAEKHGNATPSIAVHETVRKVMDEITEMVDRSGLRLIQTPQVFWSSLLKKAYEQPFDCSFTDDASVLERTGEKIHLVEGNRENIKVTEPVDLVIAEALMNFSIPSIRPKN